TGTPGYQENPVGLSDVYWWPGLGTEVQQFVSRCDACARNKSDTKKPGGLLQPLEIPDEPWESVSLDFITDLPKTRDGHTAILVFVDRLTKMHMFSAYTGYHVYWCPIEIRALPNRFWQEVTRTLGTKLKMSSAFHPRRMGKQSGRIVLLSRCFVPSLAQLRMIGMTCYLWLSFAVNNSVHEGTMKNPSF
ncbi:hypothetical protein CLOM_g3058, partial [Closterium sp. NIES-68]